MKKIGIVGGILGFLALGLLPQPLSAQANQVTIDIPFAFTVENTKLAAGTYTIAMVDKTHYRVLDQKGELKVTFATLTTSRPEPVKTFTLVFNAYGDQYYLAKFFHQGKREGYAIPQTDAEKELAKKTPATTKTVTK